MKYEKKIDIVSHWGKTIFIAVGAQTLKAGALVLFYNDAGEIYEMNTELLYSLMIISMVGVSYARFFTRTLKLWERFKPKYTKPNESEDRSMSWGAYDEHRITAEKASTTTKYRKLTTTVYAIGIFRALFLAVNAYVSIYALLRLVGVPNGWGIWIPGAYGVFSNFINFLTYNVSIIAKNSTKLYVKLASKKKSRNARYLPSEAKGGILNSIWNALNILKTIFLSSFGLIAYAIYSYNLTKKAMYVIPYFCLTPAEGIEAIAIASGLTSLVSTMLSKGLTLHDSLNKNPLKIVSNVDRKYRSFVPPHILMGAIHASSLAFTYYISGVNIFRSIDLDYNSTLAILLFSVIAVSGGFLEYSFTALKMYNYISKKEQSAPSLARNSSVFSSPYRPVPTSDGSQVDATEIVFDR